MTPGLQDLEDLLDVLRAAGVSKYRFGALELELLPDAPRPPSRAETRARQEALDEDGPGEPDAPRSPYDHNSLWPGGVRPKFPGSP